MEGKNSQKLTEKSKVYQFPIEEFENDINTESSKEKKKEILELFTTYNKLRSEEEFDEIEDDLHDACEEGDLEKIKIFLSKTIKSSTITLKFKIDETNQTASLFKVENEVDELIIPRTVEHESTEYMITSIISIQCRVKTVKFSKDSSVKTFYKDAFSSSQIEEIHFPASLKELKEGWCDGTKNLNKIIISSSNGQFEFKEDKYLVCKSEVNNDEFDQLLFVRRDIEEFSIPSNIKIISSYSFDNSNIKEIFIPSNVSKICHSAFSFCKNLVKVEIPTNSNLQTIESNAFFDSKIEEIYFPAGLKELKEGWCNGTKKLNKIIISPSNGQFEFKEDKYLVCKSEVNNDEFDKLLFVRRDIEEFSVPLKLSKICKYAFSDCRNLKKIEIPTNSNLQAIESFAFSSSNIESIIIPSKVSKICKYAFSDCSNLKKVEISTNSNLQTIESNAFLFSNIESIFIPPKVSKICKSAFSYCYNLKKVEIPTNSNLQVIESFVFYKSNVESIFIPSKLSKICEYAFSNCKNLRKVEIPTNSNLKTIESFAFYKSNIESIFIPSKVSKICEKTFSCCNKFQIIEISDESELKTLSLSFPKKRQHVIIMIPSSLRKLIK